MGHSVRAPGRLLLEARSFRLLWLGESVSTLGSQFHVVALAIVALQLDGGLALGAVLTAAAMPRAALMIFGGWLSDRASPRRIMLASNAARAILAAMLAGLVATGSAPLPVLVAFAVMFGAVDAAFLPAVNAFVPLLVDESRLGVANAWLQGTAQAAAILGPALAGGLVAIAGPGPAFAIDAASFVFAGLALGAMRGGSARRAVEGRAGGRGGPFEGIRYARRDPAVGVMIALATAFFFALSGPIGVAVPWLGLHRFGGAGAIGVLLAAWSGGALVGAGLGAALDAKGRPGRLVLPVGMGVGVALVAVGAEVDLIVTCLVLALMGVGGGFLNVLVLSWIQRRVVPAVRGRVLSLLVLGTVALSPLSYVLSAVIVDAGGRVVFVLAGSLVVLVAGGSLVLGAARVVDRPPPG